MDRGLGWLAIFAWAGCGSDTVRDSDVADGRADAGTMMREAGAGDAMAPPSRDGSSDGSLQGQTEEDGGEADGGPPTGDGGTVRPVRVENAGAACNEQAPCVGPLPTCLSTWQVGNESALLPGNYCTARCELAADCGNDATCPLADAFDALNGTSAEQFVNGFPAQCLKTCSSAEDCRQGYECSGSLAVIPEVARSTVASAIQGTDLASAKYCLPSIER